MTRVLLVSECCTDIRYEEMLKAGETHLSASQFMFSDLIKGFSECKDVSVTVLVCAHKIDGNSGGSTKRL